MEGQLFTWGSLSSLGGASLLTYFIVQYTKDLLDKVVDFPTDIYAALVSFAVLMVAQIAQGVDVTDWRTYMLTLANSILVVSAAAQIHQKTLQPPRYFTKRRNKKAQEDDKEGLHPEITE